MMTESRKQFEDWAKSKGMSIDFDRHTSGDYDNVFVQCCWDGWQASRAATVVKLPNLFDASPDGATYYDYMYRKSEMEKALDDVGVSYE